MPNGEANVTGNVFEILHADRHSAGHYRCSADNRVGAADTREIFVNVLCKETLSRARPGSLSKPPNLNVSFPLSLSLRVQFRLKSKSSAPSSTRASVMKRN
jgi:hypothetical protein